MEVKICVKCNIEKTIDCFPKKVGGKGGLDTRCIDCKREYGRRHAKEVYYRDIEKAREKDRLWKKNNPDKVRAQQIVWRNKNRVRFNASVKERKDRDREKYREKQRPYARKRRRELRSTVKGKLSMNVSTAIYKSVKGDKGGHHWESLVGYTLEQMRQHLENQFRDGMCWDNYGRNGWHIDHKIPISVFNFSSPEHEDFKRCWSLNNLQPMWESDNIRKSNKLTKHFQPSLHFKS